MANIITKTASGFTIQMDGAAQVSYNLDEFDGISSNSDGVNIVAGGTNYRLKITDTNTIAGATFSGTASQLEALLTSSIFNTTGGGSLQTETSAYLARITAAGGTMDTATLAQIDKFAARGRTVGWLTKVKEFAPALGDSLAVALHKFIYQSSASLTNTNLVAADYTAQKGFVLTTNTNKFLGTGFIPTSNSLSATNFGFGYVATNSNLEAGSGYVVGNNPASGDATIFGSSGGFGVTGFFLAPAKGIRSGFANYNGTAAQAYINGTTALSTGSYSSSNTYNTEITIFKSTRFASVYYETGGVGGLIITQGLTAAEALDLSQALHELYTNVGRLPNKGSFSGFLGDSITAGQNGTTAHARFAKIVAQRTGSNEINVGVPSSQLRQDIGNFVGGYTKYTQLSQHNINNLFLVYGTNDAITADANSNGDATIIADLGNKTEIIIQYFKDLGVKVVLGSLPYNSTNNSTKLTAYTVRQATAAKTKSVPFADLYNAFVDTGSPATYMGDTTHPNNLGHALIAEYLYEAYMGRLVRKPTLDFGSIAANSQASLTVTVYNAVVGMSVSLGLPAALEAGLVANAFVSANDTVTVRLTNTTGGAIDPASAQYKITVFTNY